MARTGGKYDKILAALLASESGLIKVAHTGTNQDLAQQIRTGIKSSVVRYNKLAEQLGESPIPYTISVKQVTDMELVLELKKQSDFNIQVMPLP